MKLNLYYNDLSPDKISEMKTFIDDNNINVAPDSFYGADISDFSLEHDMLYDIRFSCTEHLLLFKLKFG